MAFRSLGGEERREEQNWRHFSGLCAVLFRSPNRKRRRRAGTVDIGTWPSPATAAVPKPSLIIPKITTPNMKPRVVHENAVIGKVPISRFHFSEYPTYRELVPGSHAKMDNEDG